MAIPHTLPMESPPLSLTRNVIQKDIDILYEFVFMGALCRVTVMSITEDFGGIAIQCAKRLLRHRLVHVIASDAHSSNSRPPILSKAVEATVERLRSYDDVDEWLKRSLL